MKNFRPFLLAVALGAGLSLFGAVRFGEPVALPDVGLSVPLFVGAEAEPLDMPEAGPYAITETNGVQRLEDRFDVYDLWMALSVRGRWRDAAGNRLYVARLSARVPDVQEGESMTRLDFQKSLVRLDPDQDAQRDAAANEVAPVELLPPVRPRRAQRKNFKELYRYPTSNDVAHVYAFRPRLADAHLSPDWYLVVFEPAQGEDPDAAAEAFDEDFLDRVVALPKDVGAQDETWSAFPDPLARGRDKKKRKALPPTEETLLRRDYRRSVVNYDSWHFAAAEDVAVVDDLVEGRERFLRDLTNGLPVLRRAYARVAPSPLGGEPHTALARVFGSRMEYLAYAGAEYDWTAAVWSPSKRELVAWVPNTGFDELLRTIWHEAFHQYLDYASLLRTASPWFNEGHAELFENAHVEEDEVVFEVDARAAAFVRANAEDLALIMPAFLMMDYDDFYADDDATRLANYRLAWSVAYFLEIGAPDVRFQPFKDLRADYVKALVRTRKRDLATAEVLSGDRLKDFVDAWKKFWTK